MTAYSPDQWSDFFIATSGAAAALAGLVIVAVSVNVQQILKYKHLPARAAAAIASLILILVTCLTGLIPGQGVWFFGLEVLIFSGLFWPIQRSAVRQSVLSKKDREKSSPYEALVAITLGQLQILPFVIAALSLMLRFGGGLYWLAAGVVIIFIISIVNAWVFLVEILR